MTLVSAPAPAPGSHPLVQLWSRYRVYRPRLVAAVAMSVVNKVMDVMPELIIGAAIDVVVRGDGSFVADVIGVESRPAQLGWLAALNVVVWVLESASDYAAQVLWRGLAQAVEHDLRVEAYGHVQSLDVGWHEARTTGGTLAVLNDDVNQLERFLDVGAPTIIGLVVNVVLVGAVFAVSSWQLTLLAFAPIPVIVAGSLLFQRRLEPLYARVREAVAVLNGTLAANLGGLPTIKAFTAEQRELDRVRKASLEYRAANTRAIRSSAAFVPLIRMAILAGFTTTLLVGGYAALDGTLPVGLYSVLVFMTQRLLWPLTRVGETLDLYQRGMASARRVLALLREVATVVPGHGVAARPARGGVELRGGPRRVRRRARRARGHRPRRAARRGARRRRADRGGQVDPAAAGAPLPGPPLGPGAARRDRRARAGLGGAARGDRLREPGRVPVPRAASGTTSPTAAPTPPTSRSGPRPRRPRPTSSSGASPTATTPWSASGASPCPAGSGSASRWPGRSSATPPCSCSTRRPRRWTTRPRRRSSARSRG